MPRPRPWPTSSNVTFKARSSTRRRSVPRLRRWNRREPELVARLGGLCWSLLIAQFNYYILSANPISAPLHDPGGARPLGRLGRRSFR